MEKLINEMITNNGITLDNKGEKITLDKGYIVSLNGYEYTTKDTTSAFNKLIEYSEMIKDNNKQLYTGAWLDNGTWYIDINILVNKRRDAERIGKKNYQKAIYDIANNKSIALDYKIPFYYITKIIRNSNGEEVDEKTLATFDTLQELETFTGTSSARLAHYINDSDQISNLIEFNGMRVYKDSIDINEI